MTCKLAVSVAVEKTNYSFDREFEYLVPDALSSSAEVGRRVIVPFGRGDRRRQAIITDVHPAPEGSESKKLKSVISVPDDSPVLSPELMMTARFMSERCFCTLYDAVRAMLPTGVNYRVTTVYGVSRDCDGSALEGERLRLFNYLYAAKKPVRLERLLDDMGLADSALPDEMVRGGLLYKSDEAYRRVGDASVKMVSAAAGADADDVSLTPRQREVFELICDAGAVSVKEIRYFTGASASVLDALFQKGLVYFFDEEVFRVDSRKKDDALPELILSTEQQKACDNLYSEYVEDAPKVSLLYGVTGSGKTSVFMKLIERVLGDGRGVIVMVPEISLTPQFISLFSKRFGDSIAVFHSALSLGERLDEYKRVKKGLAKIVIGTRSAVFAPFERLGLVIMDEEQEHSYKSESSPRYHAREVAMYRVARHNALLVLSSATPSVESFYFAKSGRYSLNVLPGRYGSAVLPEVIVADMNAELAGGNATGFSNILLEKIQENLIAKRQSILLLNRRGHDSFVTCTKCGEALTCPSCSISLTYHIRNNRLMCHYCGYSEPYTGVCPECSSNSLRLGGNGTQKAEERLLDFFEDARVLRMDADTAGSKASYERMINAFSRGDYDILVGTQMVAKGLDFPNVTLVGVLNTDHALYADDYRSYERAFSLLTQVVGRSGRGDKKGIAIIQTHTPDNLIISMAARQDYDAFFDTEIEMRRAMLYPPFADICVVGFACENQPLALRAANAFLADFTSRAKADYPKLPLRIMGPSPARVIKVSNKYRYKLIIKCKNSRDFRELMSRTLKGFGSLRDFSRVSVFADMNALQC